MKKIFIISLIFFVASCAENYLTIKNKTSEIGSQSGFEAIAYQTKSFKIFTLHKISDSEKNLRIYFEGDGHAFINKNLAAQNPTPTSYFLINLIRQDPTPNIVYIARPCQFISDEKCQKKYWTEARFSAEILTAVDEVVKNFAEFKLELIGYSGGAEVAKYVAAHNKNIVNFRTIAGNVDPEKFTEIHRVLTLEKSASEAEIFSQLAKIPQIHFVGSADKIVPRAVAESYLKKLSDASCVKIVMVDGASHSKGWQERWLRLLEIKPTCATPSPSKP